MRTLITGGPKTGKSTLAHNFNPTPILHTDDLIPLHWHAQSDQIAQWLDIPTSWVIEGHAVIRGLRKWLRTHPTGLPFDQLIYLTKTHQELQPSQRALALAILTIFNDIEPELTRRAQALGKVIRYPS